MSTLNMETTTTQNGATVNVLSGNLTFNFNEMLKELGDKHHGLSGDVEKLITKLPRGKLSEDEASDLFINGTRREFYNDIWCYICIRPGDFANYMFSHIDSENRDNNFERIRHGVLAFYNKGFNIYIIPNA